MAMHGEAVPRDVREMYDRGLQYLAGAQHEEGGWGGSYQGAGTTGMAVMALLASGEDPNFGVYSNHLRRALRSIIRQQDANTGYFGNSMYHHGFATLALSEAYGAVDDRDLWPEGEARDQRSIGAALELAVRGALTSQQGNPTSAWRYSPQANDADTSVSGAMLMGLLAARNAGIEVPDESIDKAIEYFTNMTSENGMVGYSGGFGGGFDESMARISIATLVYAISRRKDLPEYEATLKHLMQNLEKTGGGHYQQYTDYYQAQALFQGDIKSWEKWNKLLVRRLKESQLEDGSFTGQFGGETSTQLNLLALALNYRFLPIYER
nr:squalene--hopene cyclase [Posidoniimonas polymericola]